MRFIFFSRMSVYLWCMSLVESAERSHAHIDVYGIGVTISYTSRLIYYTSRPLTVVWNTALLCLSVNKQQVQCIHHQLLMVQKQKSSVDESFMSNKSEFIKDTRV